ncbi:MAG: hypothetical protein V1897_16595 [Pseudomonadota bacterium]
MVKKTTMVLLAIIVSCGMTNSELVNAQASELRSKPDVRPKDEILALKEKILEVQNNSELGFTKVVACKSVEGFGIYSPLEPNSPDPKVIFYVEPANYGVLISEGRFIIDCTVDLFVLDASGKLLARNENVRKINKISRSPVLDLYFTVELNIAKTVKQKSFVVKIVLNDRIKNKNASTSHRVQLDSTSKKRGENI